MRTVGLAAAAAIVVGNVIGTGVYTSLGFQVAAFPSSGFVILLLWLVGAVIALSGALSYAELCAAQPQSGGEYHLLSKAIHPAAGFLSGWISATVGFAAPVAGAALALGAYAEGIAGDASWLGAGAGTWLGAATIVLCAAVHCTTTRAASRFQTAFTAGKALLVAALAAAAFVFGSDSGTAFKPLPGDLELAFSPAFAVSLIWVTYAYTGWNAAAYIAGEIRDPARLVPRALIGGTLAITALYLALNAGMLYAAPAEVLRGKPEVALEAAKAFLGERGGAIAGGLICFGLISTISAMIWAGPRVSMAMGEDYRALRFLARKNQAGVPVLAVLFQSALALILLFTGTFKTIIEYTQITLTLSSALAVAGVFVQRWRQPDLPRPYRCWGYPVTPLVFLAASAWILWNSFSGEGTRLQSLYGLATIAAGLLLYLPLKALGQGKGASASRGGPDSD